MIAGTLYQLYQEYRWHFYLYLIRYGVYDHEYVTFDGRNASKLLFVSWLPPNSIPHNKMAYTYAKQMFRDAIQGVEDVTASVYSEIDAAVGIGGDDESDSEFEDDF